MDGYDRAEAGLREMDYHLATPSIRQNVESFKWRKQALRELLQQLDPARYRKEIRPRSTPDEPR